MINQNKIYPKNWQLPVFKTHEFKSNCKKFCIVIPVINEGERIKKQLERLKKYSPKIDIILADGGSTDSSMNIEFLKKMNIKTFLVKVSDGKQGTQLRMGFAYALVNGYEGIITVDGNGKDGIEAIPEFIKALSSGYDFVQGSRSIKGGKAINTPLMRHIGNHYLLSPMFSFVSGFHFTDVTNGFRGYSRRFLEDPRVKPFRNEFVSYELIFFLGVRAGQLGYRVKEIPVTRAYPKNSQTPTKITGLKGPFLLLKQGIDVALGKYNP